MKATITIEKPQIEEALREWAAKQNPPMKLVSCRLSVETGDPGDPRESGYRRESIEADVILGGAT